jgi:hypothetical protein
VKRQCALVGLSIGAILITACSSFNVAAESSPRSDTLAAHASGFDGTWRLIAPQTELRPDGEVSPPFTVAGKKAYEDHLAAAAQGNFEFDQTTQRCSSPGLPRVMLAPGRFKIYVRDDIVLMRFEWNRLFREINLGKKRQPQSANSPITFNRGAEELLVGTMMGKTDGHWEGGQLVAESAGFSDKLLDNLLPNSDALKLTERWRLKGRETLEDQVTIEDPANYARPWSTTLRFSRVAAEPFPEDICLDRRQQGEVTWPH